MNEWMGIETQKRHKSELSKGIALINLRAKLVKMPIIIY